MKYPIGTQYMAGGKGQRLCTVTDYHTTRNIAGEIVRERYVSTHMFLGHLMTEVDVVAVTIARGLIK